MVFQIAKSKKIGRLEFLEAVNTYLLFGIAASILFKAVYVIDPNTFTSSLGTFDSRSDFIYFSFVTLTTLGYGDILPVSAAARSLVVFFSVSGQLYLTMIIALLVGKYLNAKKIE
jgi:voltage-gated potassium channel Kch